MNSPALSYDETLDQIEAEMHSIGTKEFPVSDFFCAGIYVRPVVFDTGDYIIGKTHKCEHPFFLMAGSIELYTQEGKVILHAPIIDITPAGTRRFAKALSPVLFCSVHATDKLSVEEVEDDVIEKRINPLLDMKGILQ